MSSYQKRISILLAFIVYTIAAWYEVGYYHPDEHYQLIEFAGLKTGSNTPGSLAWEYSRAIRPALQPYICVAVFKSLTSFNVTDPYLCAFALRWLTAILAILIIAHFTQSASSFVAPENQRMFVLLSYFLWFMPYLNTRFSSEIWSGLSMLLAVSMVLAPKRSWHYFLAGVLMGLAFNFRFQTAIMCSGLIAWLILIRRISFRLLLLIFAGICLSLVIGILADSMYYGMPVITFVNYFKVNILQGAAAGFGTSPWYMYIIYILYAPQILIGLLLITAFMMVIIQRPKNIFVWIVLPFLLGHILISHKEGRFLFPLVYYIPVLIIQAYELHFRKSAIIVYAITFAVLIINVAGLIAITIKPAGNGRKEISRYIHQHYGAGCIRLYYTQFNNPYNTWDGLEEHFYREKCLTTVYVDIHHLPAFKYRGPELLVCSENELVKDSRWVLRKRGIPLWIRAIQKFYHGFDTEEATILYERQ